MSKFEAIKEEQMDILREVGNIGAGHSASAMAQLLNRKIDMEVPFATLLTFDELADFSAGLKRRSPVSFKNGRRHDRLYLSHHAFPSGGTVYQRADRKSGF